MKVLVSGWFSFDCGHATAGDVLAKDVVCDWLQEAGYEYEVAATPPFIGDLEWLDADPGRYSHVVFVCGPYRPGWPLMEFEAHFAGIPLFGVNVSMLHPIEEWNPFDVLLERDSPAGSRPDLTFASRRPLSPVVGVALVHPQSEYGDRQRHPIVNQAVTQLLEAHDVAAVPIDTRLDSNAVGLHTSAQIEGLIARMDTVVTTRLHGLVLSLKNGVPALAIDPISGGAKIKRQADALRWPVVFTPESLTPKALRESFAFCLSREARDLAAECRDAAIPTTLSIRNKLLAAIAATSTERGGGAPHHHTIG